MNDEATLQEILAANERFYTALVQADLAAMIDLWHHSPTTECVHPGWDRLRGWTAIRQSWMLIFQQGPIPVEAIEPLVSCRDNMAWLTCYENVSRREGPTVQISQMLATNVFEQVEGRWCMVVHHASPAPPGMTQPRTWRTSVN
jgi:ketosteroid isomerase-like protein